MANYFVKSLTGGVYLPGEIAVCEFSLHEGVKPTKYQTLIDPGFNIYGHHYEAQKHSETSHNLPIPPNALGDKNLKGIYNSIIKFIYDAKCCRCAPVYTDRNSIQIVQSVLQFLKGDIVAKEVKVYPLQQLLHIFKEATCVVGGLKKPKNVYITDAYFEQDLFEYQEGIACQYHEKIDRGKYCTQSYVTRWGYMFADYMCGDLGIPLVPGRHFPTSTNLDPSKSDDVSSATAPLACVASYYDEPEASMSEKPEFSSLADKSSANKLPATTDINNVASFRRKSGSRPNAILNVTHYSSYGRGRAFKPHK